MVTRSRWKTSASINRIVLPKKPKKIGGQAHGKVVIGRLQFKGGKWKRVAVKLFFGRLPNEVAMNYQKVINDLRRAGVRLPKMGMLKMPHGRWVLVSQLFGSSKASKIEKKSFLNIKTMRGKVETIVEFVKVANAGYPPEIDLVEPFRDAEKGIIPIDLDSVVLHSGNEFNTLIYRARCIAHSAEWLSAGLSNEQYKQLCDTALRSANPVLRRELHKVLPDFSKP